MNPEEKDARQDFIDYLIDKMDEAGVNITRTENGVRIDLANAPKEQQDDTEE